MGASRRIPAARTCWSTGRARRTCRAWRVNRSFGRPVQVPSARLADDLAVLAGQLAMEEGRLDAGRELDAFERRIALCRLRILRADGPRLGRIDERDVGVEPFGDIALGIEPEAPCRVVARERRHAVVRQPALAP